jgi:hypothetical protein
MLSSKLHAGWTATFTSLGLSVTAAFVLLIPSATEDALLCACGCYPCQHSCSLVFSIARGVSRNSFGSVIFFPVPMAQKRLIDLITGSEY